MDRVALKEKAKKMIEGNKWFLWKPMVFFNLIVFAIAFFILLPVGIALGAENSAFVATTSIVSYIISLVEGVFMFGYAKYVLSFVRGKKEDWKEPFKLISTYFVPAILISLLYGLNVGIGTILLIVPGIMAAIGLIFVQEVFVDNQNLGVIDTLRKAWDLTNGHKMDLFVLSLSFLGWILLTPFTLGILIIWLMPYMTVTFTLAYEALRI